MDAAEQAVAQITQRAADAGVWVLKHIEYRLGGEYDRAIVSALRRLDPSIAPLWITKVYNVSGREEKVHRQLLARYVPDPRVQISIPEFERRGIRNVAMPSPVPEELKGLPSAGPYLEMELLEEISETSKPGAPIPMTWALFKAVEASQYAIRNHSVNELDIQRIAAERRRERQRQASWEEDVFARIHAHREWVKKQQGELVRVPSTYGGKASMSEDLMRLRKIAAEGAQA